MDRIQKGEAIQFDCPFCTKTVIATDTPPQVFHAHPLCETFKKLTVEEYIEAVSRLQQGN